MPEVLNGRFAISNPGAEGHAVTACPNCDREAVERFCPHCGQKRGDLFPSLREWIGEVFDELFAVDARLPRSLRKLAWPPGELTLEWRRGRRAQYVSPFRLYLAAAFLLFLAWPHTSFESGLTDSSAGFLDGLTEGYSRAQGSTVTEEPEFQSAVQVISEALPSIVLVLFVPLFAGLLFLVNRKDGRYVGNLIAAFHIHTVVFLAVILTLPISIFFPEIWDKLGEDLLAFGLLAFIVASVRRVYQTTTLRALGRTALVTVLYFLITLIVIGSGVGLMSARQ